MVHFGLIGARLGHSLSPQIHQLIFKELGVEGTYDLLEIPPEELYASVHELRGKYCDRMRRKKQTIRYLPVCHSLHDADYDLFFPRA